MKRLFSVILCASALATFGFGSTRTEVVHGQASQKQKSETNYDIYVGQYEVAKDFILAITNENGKLMGNPGDEKVEFKPEVGPDEFFSSAVNAHLKFARDTTGAVIAVVVTIEGKPYYSKKIK